MDQSDMEPLSHFSPVYSARRSLGLYIISVPWLGGDLGAMYKISSLLIWISLNNSIAQSAVFVSYPTIQVSAAQGLFNVGPGAGP